jgi:hypothetical protein
MSREFRSWLATHVVGADIPVPPSFNDPQPDDDGRRLRLAFNTPPPESESSVRVLTVAPTEAEAAALS